MLKFYNTLSKKIEEFKPLNPPDVGMYICGPTVYDYFHIGNARTFIMADIIRRYLEYRGYNVKYVMNITDIDDKIIKKAIDEKVSSDEVARRYTYAFLDDLKSLKVKEADLFPKATNHISDIVEMIQKIVDKGLGYDVDGNVFFDVNKFKDYGKLSGKNIDDLEAGARVDVHEAKNNPLDFALWKKAREGEPYWESPWGKGRPGWHIECSAMGCRHLGDTFDIHTGGNDLIFPHHENEIAQSEGANAMQFVKYWIHFGFLNINKEKMSKSLGNFFTAREVLQKYSAEALRLLFAQAHYRGPLEFSDDLLDAAEKGLEKINNLADKIRYELKHNRADGIQPKFDFDLFEEKFKESMDDDFNTPQAIAIIFDFIKDVNKVIAGNERIHVEFYKNVIKYLDKTANNIFGIYKFDSETGSHDYKLENNLIEYLIELRQTAREEKDFNRADNIRNKLEEFGILLEDKKGGTIYKKTN